MTETGHDPILKIGSWPWPRSWPVYLKISALMAISWDPHSNLRKLIFKIEMMLKKEIDRRMTKSVHIWRNMNFYSIFLKNAAMDRILSSMGVSFPGNVMAPSFFEPGNMSLIFNGSRFIWLSFTQWLRRANEILFSKLNSPFSFSCVFDFYKTKYSEVSNKENSLSRLVLELALSTYVKGTSSWWQCPIIVTK